LSSLIQPKSTVTLFIPHYDLRLEIGGILKSWILPKGLAVHESEKRLAIEDVDKELHSMDSISVVEDGYENGEAEVWDSGFCHVEEKIRGRIVFRLEGERFSGRFLLLLPSCGGWYKKGLWVLVKL
jgi:bifunctional non-homologous end joining protein LigD